LPELHLPNRKLADFLETREKFRGALVADEAQIAQLISVGVEEHDRRRTDDAVALHQLLMLRLVLRHVRFDAREALQLRRHCRIAERARVELLTRDAP